MDPPTVDEPGYASGDMFVLHPFTNLVWKVQQSELVDETGAMVDSPADLGAPKAPRVAKTVWFAFRTGHGFATAAELRELLADLDNARAAEETD
ncbi:hypothetical protein [Amycolatopsis rubida]|nr:hypothetical protein [Amycolatopsis rubida]